MPLILSKKKLRAERDRLKAEISIIATRNAEQRMDDLIAGKVHGVQSVDEILEPILPLSRKVVEIENKIIALSSKRELLAERDALQSQIDLLLQGSKSLFNLSEEEKLSVREINGNLSKLDYAIKSKSRFGGSADAWFDNVRAFFILAVGAIAIGSIVYRLFN